MALGFKVPSSWVPKCALTVSGEVDLTELFHNYNLPDALSTIAPADKFISANGDEDVWKFSKRMSTGDGWVKILGSTAQNAFRYTYQQPGSQGFYYRSVGIEEAAIRGSFPTFTRSYELIGGSTEKSYQISRTSAGIEIKDLSTAATTTIFRPGGPVGNRPPDGVVPSAILVLLQGAGGGGAAYTSTSPTRGGAGGGAGGTLLVALNFIAPDGSLNSFKLTLGAAGRQGIMANPNQVNGTAGTETKIQLAGSSSTAALTAGGGAGGEAKGATGGTGGTNSISIANTPLSICAWVVGNNFGAAGGGYGKRGSNNDAELYPTTNTDEDFLNQLPAPNFYKTLSSTGGTTATGSNAGGGGGASILAAGGNGGQTGVVGSNGTQGSGGGGGGGSGTSGTNGGNGGPGYAILYI